MVVAAGFRPDLAPLRELRVALDPAVQAPPRLAPLIDPNVHSCGTVRPHGEAELRHPEPGFYIAGMKSYGRAPTFLLATGHEQVRSIAAALAGDWEAARDARLELPETGVCSGPGLARDVPAVCCTPATPQGACCEAQPELAAGAPGCSPAPSPRLRLLLRVSRSVVVLARGTAQTLAWASSYYLVAIVADPIARDLGISGTAVFAAFSAALLVSTALGPAVGRVIDRRSGRGVLCLSNLVFAAGLMLLAAPHGPVPLTIAWLVLGAGMALGLYDSAFAALAGLYGREARSAITGITLIAGFASTVGWPFSAFLASTVGWRGACLAWAGLHLTVGLPLNRFLVPPAPPPPTEDAAALAVGETAQRSAMVLLAFVFTATAVVSTGVAAHLPRLLQAAGASASGAIAAAALVGPAQVAAHLFEFGLLRRAHPLASARIATVLHPAGAAALMLLGGPTAAVFTVLHGAGNGLLTIAKGTLPLALFGPAGYGLRTGVLSVSARIVQAGGPLLFGLLLDRVGLGVLLVSSGLGLASTAALLASRSSGDAAGVPVA